GLHAEGVVVLATLVHVGEQDRAGVRGHLVRDLRGDDDHAVVVAADHVTRTVLDAAAGDRPLDLDHLDALGNDRAPTLAHGHGGALADDLAGVAAVAVADDADGVGPHGGHGVLRTPESDLGSASGVHHDDVAGCEIIGQLAVAVALEPDAVRIDDVLGGVELPHRLVGGDAPHGGGVTPELHALPE